MSGLKIGLGFKFVLLVIGILSVTLGVTTALVINLQNNIFEEQLDEKGKFLGNFISLISTEAILSFDYTTLDFYMKEATSRPDVVYGVVLDNKGIALTSYMDYKKPQVQSATHRTKNISTENILLLLASDTNIIHMKFKIEHENELLGYAKLGVSKHRLEMLSNQVLAEQLVGNFIIIVFLSISIYLVFRFNAMRPIKSLIRGSERVAKGNLEEQVKLYSHDELGDLSTSFNQMMTKLKSSIDEKDKAMSQLSELNVNLEDRVKQRTSELENSETRIRTIYDNVGEGIFVIDQDGFIETLNPASRSIFEIDHKQAVGMHATLLLSNVKYRMRAQSENYDDEVDGPFKATLSKHPIEIEGYKGNDTIFPMELVVNNMKLGNKKSRVCIVRDITQRKEAENRLEEAQKKIVNAAHKSGMAEMATGVLHNIGNILNSVNISVEEIYRIVNNSNIRGLIKANGMLVDNMNNIGEFLSLDKKGKKLPEYYLKLGKLLQSEFSDITNETKVLSQKTTMMKEVISTQQSYASAGFFTEEFNIIPIVQDALKVQESSLNKWGIFISKEFNNDPVVIAQKSKLLQILTNLIKNAQEAMINNDTYNRPKIITITIDTYNEKSSFISVADTGCGIDEHDISNIFSHGYTTKKNGHGFGLHSCANAMTEMGGTLTVNSEGKENGSCFTLSIPTTDTAYKTATIDSKIDNLKANSN